MDSCHIFNFLFGTRKATSELRKCFTASRRKSKLISETTTGRRPPVSPLKQIQLRIINFASSGSAPSSSSCTNEIVVQADEQEELAQSVTLTKHPANTTGTYKATLIELPMDEEEEELMIDENNNQDAGIMCTISEQQNNSSQLAEDKPMTISNDDDDEANRITTSNDNSKQLKHEHRVRHLVRSFESTNDDHDHEHNIEQSLPTQVRRASGQAVKVSWPPRADCATVEKPTTIVKPLPPKTPPKSKHVRRFNLQLALARHQKSAKYKIEQLFQDEHFLKRHFFAHLQPLDRCSAAQVCRLWRNILYSNRDYWRDLVGVVDCSQLRRDYLLDCILQTLHSARLKPDQLVQHDEEVWRIQELCNRYSQKLTFQQQQQQQKTSNGDDATAATTGRQLINSKSSSIPSQISSTLSSSLSSLLSPLSEAAQSSATNSTSRDRLYTALDERGFDTICLFGATDDDIEELISKTRPEGAQATVRVGRLNNCPITDRGLELFVGNFQQLEELELTGCNELSNSLNLRSLRPHLKRLIITDCVNIADGLAQRLIQDSIFQQLEELTIQAYHLTDAFLDYLSSNSSSSSSSTNDTHIRLNALELPNCKELTNSSMLTIAKHFTKLERLSISGSSKITDDGLELLCEHAQHLRSLDLSWCTKITDVTLECVACDLSVNLRELNLDRNSHITDIGLGYLATMSRLETLSIRWCSRITDLGLESILTLRTLKRLALAGLHQITARSLLCLCGEEAPVNLEEVELTNCACVNSDLMQFLRSRMPAKCQLIF